MGGEVRRGRGGEGMGGERREKEGERGKGRWKEEGDGRTNPKPAAMGLFVGYGVSK